MLVNGFHFCFLRKCWNSSDLETNVSTVPREFLAYPSPGSYGSLMRNPVFCNTYDPFCKFQRVQLGSAAATIHLLPTKYQTLY